MPRNHVLLVTLLLVILVPTIGYAQDGTSTPVVAGQRVTVHSTILDEDRPVWIHTPNGYDQTSDPYPVMYLLDGNAHFLHTAGIIEFLAGVGYMSPMIVVALPNTDRTRDLTPALSAPAENMPTAGGADNFLAFIADELMPYVEANYRTAPYEVLVGHSFGGLFAVHALITRPEVFDAYVAISPSLWWDEKGLVTKAEHFFREHEDLEGYLYMTIGNEGGAMLAAAWEMAGVLEEFAPETLDWHFEYMAEETHGSIPHRTTYDALETLYASWPIENMLTVFESGSLESLDAHYAALADQFGYDIRTPEGTVNQMGYFVLGQERVDEAVVILERNVETFPMSVNVYDSVGDAYDAAGRLADAKASYGKACSMGRESDHPNTGVYCDNFERASAKMNTGS